MSWRRRLAKIGALFHRRKPVDDLEEEIRSHLAMEEQENLERGMSPGEAHYAALRRFGNVTRAKERSRQMWGWQWIETLLQDLRYGLRQLRRNPGFTAIAVITLALGIGANTAVFSVVNAVLVRPLQYPHADRLVLLRGAPVFRAVQKPKLHFEAADWLNHNRSFEATAIYEEGEVNLAGAERPERVRAAEVTRGFFQVLGVAPYGRAFVSEEEAPGRDQVAILSQQLCRRFGAPSDVIGRAILLNGMQFTVVGVMPAGFSFPGKTQIWIPMPLPWTFEDNHLVANTIFFTPVGRLRPGVTPAQARDEVIRFASAPPGNLQEAKKSVEIIDLRDALVGHDRSVLWLLLGAVGFVLLIACADIANLLLVRTASRQREVGVRAALGASRTRLVRQGLTESTLLSFLGGTAGLLLAVWSFRALRLLVPPNLAFAGPIRLDVRVLAFTLTVSLLVGIVLGLLISFRSRFIDLSQVLREAGPGPSLERGLLPRGRSLLAVSEVALALLLLIGAGLLAKSFWRLSAVDPGFNPQRVMTAQIILAESLYHTSARRMEFYEGVLRNVRSLPGVRSAAFASNLPLSGAYSAFRLRVEEKSAAARHAGQVPFSMFFEVSPGYFRSMEIPLIKGRLFSQADSERAGKVAIVSQSLSQAYWPGESPLGKHIGLPGKPEWLEVVGVVGDTRDTELATGPSGDLYVPLGQWTSPAVSIVIRTAGDPAMIAGEVRRAVAEVDRNEPVSDFLTMEQRVSASMAGPRFRTTLFVIFAGLALTLALVGIYGVISYSVTYRTHEIGIRIALGAEKRDVLKMVVGQGLKLALIGVAIGIAGALALTRFLSSMLYGIKPTDPLTFIAVSLILIAVALLACYIPARRAAKVDPMVALRYE